MNQKRKIKAIWDYMEELDANLDPDNLNRLDAELLLDIKQRAEKILMEVVCIEKQWT